MVLEQRGKDKFFQNPRTLAVGNEGCYARLPSRETIMAYQCNICGKGAQAANNVSHSNRKSRKFQRPNLQSVRAVVDGRVTRVRACTRCIRSGKVTKAA